MKQRKRRSGWQLALAATATAALLLALASAHQRSAVPIQASLEHRREALVARGVPAEQAAGYSDRQIDRMLGFLSEDLDPDVAALRLALDEVDAPESSACALVRESDQAARDATFARHVERICVAWRKVMWDYAEAHAADVERGDPEAIERARNMFAALDMGLMQELIRAGGGAPEDVVPPAPPDEADPPAIPRHHAPDVGTETVEHQEQP